jgi:hypothetical protein
MYKSLPLAIVLVVASVLVGFAAQPALLAIDTRSIPLYQPPIVENSVIMVPFRPIFEAFGWTVTWDNEKKTAVALLGKRVVQVTIGQDQALVDGASIPFEARVRLASGGWTMVPLSFVEQALGVSVRWSPDAQTLAVGAPQLGQSISLGFTVTNP